MAKPPSWNEIRANATAFSARWADESKEQAEAQTFWNEFLGIFGVDRRRVAQFEKRAERASTHGSGRIDLIWPGTLVAEHKSLGKSLDDAEAQALDYLGSLKDAELPDFILTSDFELIRVLDLTEKSPEPVTVKVSELHKEVDRFGFIAGYKKRAHSPAEEEAANIDAAKLMARFYTALSADGYDGHESNVFMMRLLFLFFGDDTGMWEKGLFHEYLESRTQADGSDTGAQLASLFQTLDQPEEDRSSSLDEVLARFPYVNGGLFEERIFMPTFTSQLRDELVACCAFDWSAISPAIFGSLFQAVKSRKARRELGEHYTTEKNILRVIRPLFLDQLEQRFEASKNQTKKLASLHKELGSFTFLDPACGCGNFLVVSYRELRRLELKIILRLRELRDDHQLLTESTLELECGLDQFFGIEIEDWPAQIANTAMFLVDHQLNLELAQKTGQAADRLPIEVEAVIRRASAPRTDWNLILEPTERTIVLGNPPFHGMSLMTKEQQEDNRIAFGSIGEEGSGTGRLDYAAAWYAKAIGYLDGSGARAAFVSTNSITQGEQARVMEPLLKRHGFQIDFAHRTFKWTSEAPSAAAVHVVIIGFSEGNTGLQRQLFDYQSINDEPVAVEAETINFWLLDAEVTVPAQRGTPLLPELPDATQGSKPWDGGHLLITEAQLPEIEADPIARKYVKPFMGAQELLKGKKRWCLWLEDAPPRDLQESAVLRQRLAAVREVRAPSPTKRAREKADVPYLFVEIRQPTSDFIALPQTSSSAREYVPGTILTPEVVPSNGLFLWSDPPDWLFTYLQSAAFMAWLRIFSGRMKSDYQIAPDLIYSTFPFVKPNSEQAKRLKESGESILAARANYPGSTLADLYGENSMPLDLRRAHQKADRMVDGLYGLRKVPTEGDRVKRLMAKYRDLTEQPT